MNRRREKTRGEATGPAPPAHRLFCLRRPGSVADRHPFRGAPKATRRFSLIELFVVLAIVGLVFALITPRVAKMPTGLLVKQTASRLEDAFRRAALRARATGKPVRLVADPETNTVRLQGQQGAAGADPMLHAGVTPANPAAGNGGGASFWMEVDDVTFDEDVVWETAAREPLAGETLIFLFYPSGEAAGPSFDLVVRKRRLRFVLDRLTGRLFHHEVEP